MGTQFNIKDSSKYSKTTENKSTMKFSLTAVYATLVLARTQGTLAQEVNIVSLSLIVYICFLGLYCLSLSFPFIDNPLFVFRRLDFEDLESMMPNLPAMMEFLSFLRGHSPPKANMTFLRKVTFSKETSFLIMLPS